MTTRTAPARNWNFDPQVGAFVAFLNADAERRVDVGTTGRVVWVADEGMAGRDVELSDGRVVNIPAYELEAATDPRDVRRLGRLLRPYLPAAIERFGSVESAVDHLVALMAADAATELDR